MDHLYPLRHHLHAYPELSGNEKQTQKFICHHLNEMGIAKVYTTKGDHSVLAEVHRSGTGPVVLFRCEMDALPIEEVNDLSYRSTRTYIAHTCGHDGHMAIMLGFIRAILDYPPGEGIILALFQSAEETGEGAQKIIDSGNLQNYDIDYVFAMHNIPGYPLGTVICKTGLFTPAVESISIELHGKTSHAGEPDKGMNPAGVLGDLITYLNGLHHPDKSGPEYCVSTPIQIQMGEEAYGTSAGHAVVRYTFRTWDGDQLQKLKKKVEHEVLRVVFQKMDMRVEMEWKQPFKPNNNHQEAVNHIRTAARKSQLEYVEKKEPFEWGEDFGLFTATFKGAMFGLGSGEDCPALHHPNYDFPDALIPYGIRMFHHIARCILA